MLADRLLLTEFENGYRTRFNNNGIYMRTAEQEFRMYVTFGRLQRYGALGHWQFDLKVNLHCSHEGKIEQNQGKKS